MKLFSKIAILWLSLGLFPFMLQAADSGHAAEVGTELEAAALEATHDEHHGEGEHHGLPPAAVPVFSIGPLQVTNSMVVTTIVAILLIVFAQMATKNIQEVPSGSQNFFEWLVESLFTFLEGIMGYELVKKNILVFCHTFHFHFSNQLVWFSTWCWNRRLGNLGWHFEPWLRGGHADLNMTTAMAIAFFVMWCVWSIQANGVTGVYNHIFGNKGGGAGFMKAFMIAIFLL
jgi:F-type H+-transporting ATPase subunit a